MRPVTFRAKNIKTGEWEYTHDRSLCDMSKGKKGETRVYFCQTRNDPKPAIIGSVEVDPDTLGQATGLKDKNGKEIYEGDILHIDDDELKDVPYVVKWDKDALFSITVDGDFTDILGNSNEVFEVIGNIYDNPEMRKHHS